MSLHRWLIVSKVVLACASVLTAGCGPNIPETIKIGVAQPLSGPSAARGQDLLNGVNMAVAELNAAGFKIAGKPVKLEVVARDDKADVETAKKVAQELVDQKVTAVIGHLSSDITAGTIEIYKKGNVPQLFTSSAAELIKQGEGNTFRLVANDALQAQAIAGYLGETLRANTVSIIYEDTAFGRPMSKDLAAALEKQKKTVQLNEATSNKTTDFAAYVAKLKATPPDVLVAVLRDNQLLPLFEQMKAAGLSGVTVISTNSSKTDKLAKAPADINKLYVTSSALEPREFIGGNEFLKKFMAVYKAEPVWAAHYAYDAVYVLTSTMKRADSVDPAVLRTKLRTLDMLAPVTNGILFTAEGEQRYPGITVYRKQNGKWDPLMSSDKW